MQTNTPIPLSISFKPELCSSLKSLLTATTLPSSTAVNPPEPWALGIDLDWLKSLKASFESDEWKVADLLKRINEWPNYFVRMKASPAEHENESVHVHFLHVRSKRQDAIPLMMLHGWPGMFWDFHKVIEPLTNPPDNMPAFHLVIPSLPGYFLSTHPRRYEWSFVDSSKLLHRLMTEVLGYSRYAGQGGDWGSYMLRVIGHLYPAEAPVLHFNMFRAPVIPDLDPTSFSPGEQKALQRSDEFTKYGRGYNDIQSTKPFTIGIAIGASPVSLLTYIGEKMYAWSDPHKLDTRDVLDTVALYYLSQCFATSVMIYHQDKETRREMTTLRDDGEVQWKVGSKIGYTLFPYEIGASPRSYISAVGDLVFYKERASGGHFPALDNPEGLVEDLREFIGKEWKP